MKHASIDAADAMTRPRIAIEAVTPSVDGGRFPVKTIVNRPIEVEADIFADGHEVLKADVLWRAVGAAEWRRAPMTFVINDRWAGAFTPEAIGRHEYAVEAWWDDFGTFRRDLTKKRDAGLDVKLETDEGLTILEEHAAAAPASEARAVADIVLRTRTADTTARIAELLSSATAAAAKAADPRAHATRTALYPLEVERVAAGFASWYELFPRSETDDPTRHGTFRDVIERCRRSATWASTCSTSRRSIRSARPIAKAATTRLTAGARRSGQPLRDRLGTRAATMRSIPSSARSRISGRCVTAAARARAGDRARLRDPVLAGSSVAEGASGLVRLAAGRLDQIRREPAEEIRGHRQCRLLRPGRGARPVAGAARRRAVLGRARACGSSASTTRTPNRSRSGSG